MHMRNEDGRARRGGRIDRIDNQCTICGTYLGEDTTEWGLIWDSGTHGACEVCVARIRRLMPRKKVKPKPTDGAAD